MRTKTAARTAALAVLAALGASAANVTKLDFSDQMNMSFTDESAGDQRGGWHDHGENDARNFPLYKEKFAGVPFKVQNPAVNNDRSICVFRNSRKKDGCESVTVRVEPAVAAKYLYLLHDAAWGMLPKDATTGPVAKAVVTDAAGRTATFDILLNRDVREWWWWGKPKAEFNCFPAAQIPAQGGNGYAYVAEYPLPADFGKVAEVKVVGVEKPVAYYMLIAMTLADGQLRTDVPEKEPDPYVVRADRTWRVFPFPAKNGVVKGSIVDFASNVGDARRGEVVLGVDGEYRYADDPERKPLRFMFSGGAIAPFWGNPSRNGGRVRPKTEWPQYHGKAWTENLHSNVQYWVDAYADLGYNMLFFHDDAAEGLMQVKGPKPGDIVMDESQRDLRDWQFKCMKDRGMKRLGGASWLTGYWQVPWSSQRDESAPKWNEKDEWVNPDSPLRVRSRRAMELNYGVPNRYTGFTYLNDPDLLSLLMRNECDKGALTTEGEMPAFRAAMRRKYGTIERLRAAWGECAKDYADFDTLPNDSRCWGGEETQRARDYVEYILSVDSEAFNWWQRQCRELGYRGPCTTFDMTKEYYYSIARAEMGSVHMHVYHGHPMGNDISQESPLMGANGFFRGMVATQFDSKPFFMTEAEIPYWNRYRYEQAFLLNAYAALNGFDGLLNFTGLDGGPARAEHSCASFFGHSDPICYAQEVMGMHLFRRGAVRKSPVGVRLQFSKREMLDDFKYRFAPAGAQTKLALVFRFGLETPETARPLGPNDVRVKYEGGAATRREKLFHVTVEKESDSSFDIVKFLDGMKAKGLLPKTNRTDPRKDVWESCTGELYLDAKRAFGAVDTATFQGVVGKADAANWKTQDVEFRQMTRNGTLNVWTPDGTPVRTAKRLAVCYATNAMNLGAKFTDESWRTVIDKGTASGQVVYECGRFEVRIANDRAKGLRAWAVGLDGARLQEVACTPAADGRSVTLAVDVAQLACGPAVFFELAER